MEILFFPKIVLTLWLVISLTDTICLKQTKEETTMKQIRLYITAVVLALAGIMGTQASAQVLRDADFNSIGRINGNGLF